MAKDKDSPSPDKPAEQPEFTLDAEQRGRLEEWFEKEWKLHECPVCGETDNWAPNAKLGQILNVGSFVDGTSFPVVLFRCGKCGYVVPINAIAAGVVSRDDDPAGPMPGVEFDPKAEGNGEGEKE